MSNLFKEICSEEEVKHSHHENKKPFQCNVCGQTFRQSSYVKCKISIQFMNTRSPFTVIFVNKALEETQLLNITSEQPIYKRNHLNVTSVNKDFRKMVI